MSRQLNPQDLRHILPEVSPEDGALGYLVTKHWSCWLAYAVKAILIVGLIGSATYGVFARMEVSALRTVLAILIGVAWLLVVKFLYLDAKKIRRSFVLVTRLRIYENRVEHLFYNPTKNVPAKGASSDCPTESRPYGWFGVRRLVITTVGNLPNITFRFAAGGEDMENGVSHLLAKATAYSSATTDTP